MSSSMKKAEKVFVGLSGGVDSSVAAMRLIEAGYDVVGVFIKVWHPDFLVCNWEEERLDAMRVAAHLDIPFFTCDAEAAYKKHVADYMIAEYKEGRTPNPDVMCNKEVKFGVFLNFALKHGADKIATGHYARLEERDGNNILLRGVDTSKDQSYFLWTLTEEQRSHILFPVGNTTKKEIRREASLSGLNTAEKADSQGICFLGHVDIQDFLSHYTDARQGEVRTADGAVVGTHDGALFYTLGQRHGFTINVKIENDLPYYVKDKNLYENIVIVSHEPPTMSSGHVELTQVNEILPFDFEKDYQFQFRYRQRPIHGTLKKTEDGRVSVCVLPDTELPPKGQSCVVYDKDICIGGGIIS